MKKMSKMMKKVANDLLAQLDKFAASGEDVDGKDLSFKFTVTIIANAGVKFNINFRTVPKPVPNHSWSFETCLSSQGLKYLL